MDFWDTNIVLGYTVEWDDFTSPVDSYLQTRASERELIASTRVFDEALKVVENQRRRARQAADRVFGTFDAGQYDTIDDVQAFVHSEFAEDWQKVGPILSYIDHHDSAFLGLTQTNSERALRATFEEIADDFATPKQIILRLKAEDGEIALAHFDQGLRNYQPEYEDEHQALSSLLDDLDRDILLDSYHLIQVTPRESLGFLTFDATDIIDNREEIEKWLSGISIVDGWEFE